jgi:hypothetical protein
VAVVHLHVADSEKVAKGVLQVASIAPTFLICGGAGTLRTHRTRGR